MTQLRALLQYLERQPAVPEVPHPEQDPVELSRLMSAAVVSRSFREALLRNPARAIADGYQGEQFRFSPAFLAHLTTIQARSLEEFAQRVVDLLDGEARPGADAPIPQRRPAEHLA